MKNVYMKKPSKSLLNNVENACVYMFMCETTANRINGFPPNRRAHEMRKFMYLQRHGSMKGWTRGWYTSYFAKAGHFSSKGRYVDVLWELMQDDTSQSLWHLTMEGYNLAKKALKKLGDTCNKRVMRRGCWKDPSNCIGCNCSFRGGMIV